MRKSQAHLEDLVDSSTDDVSEVMDYTNFRVITDRAVEIITEREFTDQTEYEKFMRDPVVIEIHTVSDRNAPTHAYVGVNGEELWLPRGQKIRVPRYFVERLARAQTRSYQTPDDPDPRADKAKRVTQTTSADYGFSVLQDPSPKGRKWLERVTRESR